MTKKALTLVLILQGDQVLLLNRFKKPYMGLWNGFGGKIESGETPTIGVQREIYEETGLPTQAYTLQANGAIDWWVDGQYQNKIYLFTARLQADYPLTVPKASREGLLALWPLTWATAPENYGLIADLKAVIPYMLQDEVHQFKTNFKADRLIGFEIMD